MIEILTIFCFVLLMMISYLFHKLKFLEKEHGFVLMEITDHRNRLNSLNAQSMVNSFGNNEAPKGTPSASITPNKDGMTSYIG